MVDSLQNLKSVYEKWEGRGNEARLKSQDNQNAQKVISEGKQRWKNKFGDSIRPPLVRRTREKRNFPKLRPAESVLSDSIAAFKTIPIVDAEAFRITRPFMGQCCACLPTSRRNLMTGSCTQMGLRNVLNVDHELRNRGPLARCFCHLAYLFQRRIFYKYTSVSAAVLTSGRVCDAIHQNTPKTQDITTDKCAIGIEELKAVKKRAKRAESILNNMQARVSSVLVSFTGWFLLKFLSMMTSSIQVHKGQMQLVKKATEKNVPMIYVPLHRSHLDYILVTFLLWNYDIKAPHIAAGDNLNMPIFSYLMRGLGAFFIRRRLDKQRGKKDVLYRSVLQSYIEELLRNGEGIEFFIEGGRSRTGKACYPKSGLLSAIVDAFRSDVIEDAYIVPVTISYEKLLDGNFNDELMGKRKAKETFWASMKGIWRVVRGDFGHVRAGFCQPFSLKEFMVTQVCQSSPGFQDSSPVCSDSTVSPVTSDELSPDSPPEGFFSRRGSFSSLLGSEVISSDQKETVDNLGQHIVYGAVNSTALMSTNLLAFLLLTKYRQGVSLITLTDSFAWLQDQLSDRKRDVGFSGSTEDVVSHALYLLGEELAISGADKNGNQIIEPNLSVPSVFELSYYSNSVISVFLLESVLVNSVLGVTDWMNSQAEQPLSAHRERVLDMAADICHLLRNEFIFTPTCEELRQKLAETLEDLVISELFQKEETMVRGAYTVAEQMWAKRFSESLEWQGEGSDSDDDVHPTHGHIIKVNLSDPEVAERVMFLRSVLGPWVEGYWITALTITKLREQEMAEEDFIKLLHSSALKKVDKDLVTYPESSSMEILRNAMKTYQEQKLINTYFAGNLKMVELRDNYQVEEQLQDLLDMLESLRE